MGLVVSAAQAATLVDRNERRVRDWITSGKLRAEKPGHTWLVDTDDLARISGVTVDRDRLAVLEAAEGRTSGGILARLETLEREVQQLRARLHVIELERPRNAAPGD